MAALTPTTTDALLQPNGFDRKRIERALKDRSRYLYVNPVVRTVEGGFRIESPCCSRRIDPGGGIVDIALIHYIGPGIWKLHRKDYTAAAWLPHGVYKQLDGLLEQLNKDPKRLFWQ